MSILNKKVCGSTLVESIMSMVILVAVFIVGITIYHKVMSTSISLQKIKAQQVAQKLIYDTVEEKSVFDTEFIMEDWKVIKRAQASHWGTSLHDLKIIILNSNNDTLSVVRQIVHVEE